MSLKTSVIEHPARNPYVARREWALRAIRLNRERGAKREEAVECGAELLSVFEYHRNNILANRLFQNMLIKTDNKGLPYQDTKGWLPYATSYLEECLLFSRGKEVIAKSLLILEEMRFISSNVPAPIVEYYKSGVVKWYLLEVDTINDWIRQFYHVVEKPVIVEIPKPKTEKPTTEQITTEQRAISFVCGFHRHIHNKPKTYVYDKQRQGVVLARLKEGRTYGQIAQAIIGNLFSDHHQGRSPQSNPKNKLYDNIEQICRDAQRVENHIRYAEEGGVTEEMANNEFQLFINGKTSKYAKGKPKPAQMPNTAQTKASLTPIEADKYLSFALEVVPMIVGCMPTPQLFSLVRSNETLNAKGQGLTDFQTLKDSLLKQMQLFENNPTTQILELLEEFAQNFADFQTINIKCD